MGVAQWTCVHQAFLGCTDELPGNRPFVFIYQPETTKQRRLQADAETKTDAETDQQRQPVCCFVNPVKPLSHDGAPVIISLQDPPKNFRETEHIADFKRSGNQSNRSQNEVNDSD